MLFRSFYEHIDMLCKPMLTEGADLRQYGKFEPFENEVRFDIPVKATLHTDGKGYWSDVAKPVRIDGLTITVPFDEDLYPSDLKVSYDMNDWYEEEDGLIYTDPLFLQELRQLLKTKLGLPAEIADSVTYSEQGMQDEGFVS